MNAALTLLTIKDISAPLIFQKKVLDQVYLNAIEANYSHEQMTPLNCIMGNTKIVIRRIEDEISNQTITIEKQ